MFLLLEFYINFFKLENLWTSVLRSTWHKPMSEGHLTVRE